MPRWIAKRISLLALAAFALDVSAQQPQKSVSSPQPGQPQAPQGNLTIQVTNDDGAPVPGAALEIDGMSVGGGPAGSSHSTSGGVTSTLPSGTQIIGADSSPHTSQANIDRSGLFQAHARPCPTPPPAAVRHDNGQPAKGQAPAAGAKPATQPAQPPPPPSCGLTNTVQAGTAESIGDLSGTPTGASAPALPPGAVALATDAQGQLTVQLPPGEHTLSVSVYGFDPWTGHFTLTGKHRQVVQIKLSTAPPSYLIVVGPDGRVQPISAVLDATIPLEPVATLDSLAARPHRRAF
jgi:hypothetical protein